MILDSVWLWGLYYGDLDVYSKPDKLCFETCKSLFGFLVVGFHVVEDSILIIEGFLEVPIYVREVGV